ncbi:uncharacterized protein N7511_011217 [Penicillium nucicola]|uniref:uncharacterized protein n=1 Tax=Penicillium nucicola TaxID=1850975 RepID=UPI0025453562|nr:uncharacterized protein N7511_011217 [Penicillium nucicola]KAJ5742816.1 hypothetical protein N7511_011217 [Penicillium nucicola]
MRCIRPRPQQNHQENASTEPCERCRRTNRACNIPKARPLGRKRGAVGRYQGFEKAYRKMQAELRKSKPSGTENADGNSHLISGEMRILEPLVPSHPSETADPGQSSPATNHEILHASCLGPSYPTVQDDESQIDLISHSFRNGTTNQANQEPTSNPLALLADASDAAQVLELFPMSHNNLPGLNSGSSATEPQTSQVHSTSLGRQLLHRPGYVSLGLKLDRKTLDQGLDAILAPSPVVESRYSNYFSTAPRAPLRDIGPDIDPIDLGLVTMEEAHHLFPIYFARLHPVNGILDPMLHTPEFVRAQSALLFTWILALTAQFDHESASIAKRLRFHGEKLSKHVHTSGYKSVEIVQGYYISLLSATPAETSAQERSWLYTMYAFGLAAELGLDQESCADHANSQSLFNVSHIGPDDIPTAKQNSREIASSDPEYPAEQSIYFQRLSRNRERTWLRILLWERANSAACGRIHTFPETDLTHNIEGWWLHPLADSTDKHTCAFITLRQSLAALHSNLRYQAEMEHVNPHWVRGLVDSSMQPWCDLWLPRSGLEHIQSSSEILSNIFLRYVYYHGRLWTLSFALHGSINRGHHLDSVRTDCFEAAVSCCEIAVHDLDAIGEPLYCMLAPTWAMISYAGVLALRLFPVLYGPRVGNEVELLALLGQVAMHLERAGKTPSHRFGIAALLGQHLMRILKARAIWITDSTSPDQTEGSCSRSYVDSQKSFIPPHSPRVRAHEALVSEHDPFLTTASLSTQGDLTGESFAGIFKDMFGPGFSGVF